MKEGDNVNAQLKKGVLEMCVLALLRGRDCYGFEMVTRLSGAASMAEGTVYPLLKRLRDDGLLTTYLRESAEGPPRKYYRITHEGARRYVEMVEDWRAFVDSVELLLKGGEAA